MGSAILVFVSQALAVAVPAASMPPPGARVSAVATVEILRAETTRDDGGSQSLKRHRHAGADRRVIVEFE